MTGESRVTMHKGTAALVGLALLLTGAGASYVLLRRNADGGGQTGATRPTPAASAQSSGGASAGSDAPLPDVVVSLTADAVHRAGIVMAPVESGTSAAEMRLAGVVEPNAYRRVAVTPLVAGRVTRVSAELGAKVRRGQTLAQVYSPELAEAQTAYVSAKAMLDAHDRELQRTGKLVGIGAASRQELERIHAEHAAQTAAVESARSRLELLGVRASTLEALMTGKNVRATTSVPAPIEGIVTERAVNVGLNVDPSTRLFTVVDLSTVWVIADVYEKDFARVHVGTDAAVTTSAYPGLALHGRVSYIDPLVNSETRTGKVRIEVPNTRGELRLGMYADVVVTGPRSASAPLVPRSAIQNVGDRTVVYLANPKEPGRFTEREVRLGPASGETVQVASGLQPGDLIVAQGSFFIRAERERLGLRPAAEAGAANRARGTAAARSAVPDADVQAAKVVVNERGFEPAKVSLRAGTRTRITFVRTTDRTCATEVVFPSLDIKRALPLNEPVHIEFIPARTGEIGFACGMDMVKGVAVVE